MALGLTNRGSGNHNASALSFTLSPNGNFAAGSWAALCISADNSSTGGSTNNISDVTDSLGNTWTVRRAEVFDNGAANAGVQLSIWTTDQDIGPLQTSTVITVTFGANTVAKTWTLTEITKAAGETIAYVTGGLDPGTTTASPTLTTGTIDSGDVVIAAYGYEAGTTQTGTGDADTTNGSWTTAQYNEIGSTTSGSVILSQGKVVTGTATQTFNPTFGLSADNVGAWIVLHANVTTTGTGAGTGAASTASGSGKETFTSTGAGLAAAATASGSGVESFEGTGAATGAAATASGSGTVEALPTTGTGAGTQAAQSATGSAVLRFLATGAGTGAAATSSGSAAEVFTGTGAASGTASSSTGSGALRLVSTGAGAGAAPTSSGTALLRFIAGGSATGAAATADGSGAELFTSTGAGTQAAQSGDGTGTVPFSGFSGTGAGVQAVQTATGTVLLIFTGTGAGTGAASSGSGGILPETLPELDNLGATISTTEVGITISSTTIGVDAA